MGIPFSRTVTAVGCTGLAAGREAVALAGHLLRYPAGIHAEGWPLPAVTCDHVAGAGPTGHSPVLLVHGLFDNRSVFTALRIALAEHGREHVHSLNYSPLTVDLRTAAQLLGEHVLHTRKVYGGEKVAVVGHSLGGLIARYYVQRLGGDEHVHTVVTLGSPHEGTVSARLLHPLPVARQMLPGGSIVAELRAPAPGCGTRFLAFSAEYDTVVLPRGNAELRHPDLLAENVLVRGVGHLSLPDHPLVVAGVERALADATDPALRQPPRLTA